MNNSIDELLHRDNNNLDLLRILAAIAVIVYHSFALNPSWGLSDPTKYVFTYVTTGGLAVKIFFFVSGLLVTNSILTTRSLFHFICSRSLRIFPGLLFVVFISSFIIGPAITKIGLVDYYKSPMIYEYVYKNMILDTKYFLPGVSFVNGYGFNGSIWTIRYESYCYSFLAVAFVLQALRSQLLSSLICLAIIIEPLTPFKGILFASSDNNAIYLLAPCFSLGALLAINKKHFRKNLLIPVFLLAASPFFKDKENVFSWLICVSFCLLSFHLATARWFVKLRPKHDISYGIYLWGFPIQQVFTLHSPLNPILGIILPLMVTACFALVSWIYVERPSMHLSKTINKKYSELFINSLKANRQE